MKKVKTVDLGDKATEIQKKRGRKPVFYENTGFFGKKWENKKKRGKK
jgi:hypothetical protein